MNVVNDLEQLPGMLAHDKASILLVHAGLKPSALVVMEGEPFPTSDEPVHIDTRHVDTLDLILAELNLHYEATNEIMRARSPDTSMRSQEVMRIYLAPSKEMAMQLKIAFDNMKEDDTTIGLLLGYPETAVKAFLTPDMLDWADYPVSTEEVSEPNMRILGHRLSKAHWREEVKYLEASGNYLQRVSPIIYNEITKE